MQVPGRAWLQFEADALDDDADRTRLTLSAFFEPKGVLGTAYWNVLRPVHGILFSGLLRRLAEWIERRAPSPEDDPPAALDSQ